MSAGSTLPSGLPAQAYAAQRDWPGYFEAVAGKPARETLLLALDRFDREPSTHRPRLAVDLGCGEGRDTAELLRRGWHVLAIDGHPDAFSRLLARGDLPHRDGLTTLHAPFEGLRVPECDLVNASFSLPFCPPHAFDALWVSIVAAIRRGGRFCGQLFGDRDTWASLPDRSHQTREHALAMLDPFDLERFDEDEKPGADALGTPKHWHVFHVVARKR
ncbi:MAG: class I SAM-dependent methyltransferase [Phycisphaeraceae bacterium]|nr:class I SAM-dependent methyltransferase [Phycisphaeraceae bacterium]